LDKDRKAAAKGILKTQFVWRHLTYRDSVENLHAIGAEETEANLRNKISRGGFSTAFFLQCLTAIDAHSARLHEPD
jgi:hypothetical protein